MNHACHCGHGPADHCDRIGRCAAEDAKACDCPGYEWEGDE